MLDLQVYCIFFLLSLCENNPLRYYSQMAPSSDFRKFWHFDCLDCSGTERWRSEAVEDGGDATMKGQETVPAHCYQSRDERLAS